jgi:hypothetical protein
MRIAIVLVLAATGCASTIRSSNDAASIDDVELDSRCTLLESFSHSDVLERDNFCEEVYLRLYECATDARIARIPVVHEIPIPCHDPEGEDDI